MYLKPATVSTAKFIRSMNKCSTVWTISKIIHNYTIEIFSKLMDPTGMCCFLCHTKQRKWRLVKAVGVRVNKALHELSKLFGLNSMFFFSSFSNCFIHTKFVMYMFFQLENRNSYDCWTYVVKKFPGEFLTQHELLSDYKNSVEQPYRERLVYFTQIHVPQSIFVYSVT